MIQIYYIPETNVMYATEKSDCYIPSQCQSICMNLCYRHFKESNNNFVPGREHTDEPKILL